MEYGTRTGTSYGTGKWGSMTGAEKDAMLTDMEARILKLERTVAALCQLAVLGVLATV